MIDQQKTNEIAKITRQIDTLREQINTENAETRTHVEKRDKLNEQFKKLRTEIRELRKERDDLNENVKVLKQQRDESHITELKKKTTLERRHKLQKEFDDIEWKIQTTSLDIQEEKRLIENVKRLEKQLNICKKIDQHSNEIAELRKNLEMLGKNAEKAHQELIGLAERSQEIHAEMIAKIGESKKIKDEADSLHGTYIQVKEKIEPLREEVKRLIEHRKKLQDAVREEEAKQKKSVERALKEKLESEARNKLKRGEKLSWDEFKMLAGNESEDV